jgi:microcystin degradation protein MlrC
MNKLRIGIGRFWHESNSFSGVVTNPAKFRDSSMGSGIAVGAAVSDYKDRHDEVSGFIDVLGGRDDIELAPLISAGTLPSGPVTDEAVSELEKSLRDQLRAAGPLDGVCLALHGAMSGESIPDLDGYFLQVVRQVVGPDIPIVSPLDCHAIVTQQMIALTTALIAYRTHPHTDLFETGQRAADILLRTLRKEIQPVVSHQKIPMLFVDAGTDVDPLRSIFDEFSAWDELDGVIGCSLCPSFPYQDNVEQGWSALAVTDDDPELADRLARRLAEIVWAGRHELLPVPMLSIEAAVEQAVAVPGCPVVITDSADNVGGGTSGDTPTLLQGLLSTRQTVDGLILTHLPDADAVAELADAKPGESVTVAVGGKCDTHFGAPIVVTGELLCVASGPITNDGKFGPDAMIETGKILCLGIDNVRLVLTEGVIMGPQPSLFRKVGIEPFEAKIVALKSGTGYKVTYGQVAAAVLRADCPGAMSYNIENFDFKCVLRPIFPLDREMQWRPYVKGGNA